MKLYETTNIKSLTAGGTMMVKRMDEIIGHSKLIAPLRSRGVPLDKVINCLIAQRIDDPKSTLGSLRGMEHSAAPVEFRLDIPSYRNLCRGIGTVGRNAEELYPQIVDSVVKATDLSLKESNIDWSSIISYGDKRSMAERGHSSDHRPDLRQVKIGVCLAGKIPFHYRLDDGNVPDVKQFEKDLDKLEGRLPKRCLLIYDKGGNSKGLRREIRERGFDYLTMLKDTSTTRRLIESAGELDVITEYKTGETVYGRRIKEGREWIYVFRDERRAKRELEARRRKAAKLIVERRKLEKKVLKGKGLKEKKVVRHVLGDRIIIKEVIVQQRLEKKSDEQIEAEVIGDTSLDGYFVMVSSRGMGPKRALSRYRRRDDAEKLIDALKNVHDAKPMRAWSDNSVKGVFFICMLAALFTAMAQLLMNTKKRAGSILELIRNVTLLVKLDENGRILWKRLSGLGEFVRNFLTRPV